MSQNDDKQVEFNGAKLKNALVSVSDLSPEEQKALNQPLKDPSGGGEANKKFLDDVVAKINDGKINLFSPSSLLNQEVYQKLSEQVQGKIDMDAVNLLAKLRDMKGLYDLGQTDSYQMENLAENVRLIKERIEAEAGDVFII